MTPSQYLRLGQSVGCPTDQLQNIIKAGIVLQPKQLAASAAARLCDKPDGPKAIGYGGARGGGKSHWLLTQLGADDCQRYPELKCLLLRKSGKSNLENFEDFAQRLFHSLPHDFNASRGILTFANGSRIVLGNYQHEKEIGKYLGLEYDVIAIDEATQLSEVKFADISTCCRTSKPNWRPRIYTTTNPGGLGHQWYFDKFIAPHQSKTESATRFISARVDDNAFINQEYKSELAECTGWKRDAWYLGNWSIAAGQYFKTFRPDIHIIGDEPAPHIEVTSDKPAEKDFTNFFNDPNRPRQVIGDPNSHPLFRGDGHGEKLNAHQFAEQLAKIRRFKECDAVKWVAAMDYGYTHYTVVLLGCYDQHDNLYIVDEHAERFWIPQRHAYAIKQMLARHNVYCSEKHAREAVLAQYPNSSREQTWAYNEAMKRRVRSIVAGSDMFGSESNGDSVAKQYSQFGVHINRANMDRGGGWSALLQRLGDPDNGIMPSLFIHKRCTHLLETLPYLQHDPDYPGDILKTNTNEEGAGGDDAADALRYMIATKPNVVHVVKLRGL